MENDLSHIDESGNARMVDVGHKKATRRRAIAQGIVNVNSHTLELLKTRALPKGDALAFAKAGAILAAKQTSILIPLCHSLPLDFADVRFEVYDSPPHIRILAEMSCEGKTGVEMEAIVAVQTAAAIIYDMCKAVQKDIVITDVRLLFKEGGKSGTYAAKDFRE